MFRRVVFTKTLFGSLKEKIREDFGGLEIQGKW